MKTKEITPFAFLVQEMRYQLKEASLEIPEEDFSKGVEAIWKQALEPRLHQIINKKGFVNLRGSFLIGLICKAVIGDIEKQQKSRG
jgi:hypothetical protein